MFPDLFSAIALERMDKQFIVKMPYAFLISLPFLLFFKAELDFYNLILIASATVTFFSLVTINWVFNSRLNRWLANHYFDANIFHDTKPNYTKIVEGHHSLFGEIKNEKTSKFLLFGAIGGGLLTTFFILAVLILIDAVELAFQTIIASAFFAAIFVYYDLMKSPMERDDGTGDARKYRNTVSYALAERFLLSNSLELMPKPSATLLRLIGRICGPILRIQTPRLHYEELIVYSSNELHSRFLAFIDESKKSELLLKHMDGLAAKDLVLKKNLDKSERINLLGQRRPTDNFPYLYGQEQDTDHKVWGVFEIIEVGKTKKRVGQLYVHVFKGLSIKNKIELPHKDPRQNISNARIKFVTEDNPIRKEIEEDRVFIFIFIGELTYVKYLATELGLVARQFPRELMNVEWSDS